MASYHIDVSHLLCPVHDQKNCNSSVRQLAEETAHEIVSLKMLVNSIDVRVVGISTFDMVLFIHDNYDVGCSAPTISLS